MADPVALSQAGIVAILLALGGLVATAFMRQWVVMGWTFRDERAARMKAEDQVDQHTKAFAENTRVLNEVVAFVRERVPLDRRDRDS